MSDERRWRHFAPWIVAALFSVSGVVHLVHPSTFTGIVPHFLPGARLLVILSGVAELVCAAGLWRRSRWAGVAAAVLLLVIWPANLQDAISAQRTGTLRAEVVEWVRFPLQLPLIWCALQARRQRRQDSRARRTPRTGRRCSELPRSAPPNDRG